MFEAEHRARYGYARAKLQVECVNFRARVVQPKQGDTLRPPRPLQAGDMPPDYADVQLGGQTLRAAFFAREALQPGQRLSGPVVIEEATATTLVPPGWHATCLDTGDLLLERAS